jgi:hypothetical protein
MKSRLITRRTALVAGFASVGGALLPGAFKRLPPTYGSILRMGDNVTYAAHRLLLPGQSLAKEYSHREITSFPAIGTTDPAEANKPLSGEYGRLLRSGFLHWRLSVEGRVASPRSFSLPELKSFPARTQVTRHTCEEGWSSIGQWTGVPLARVLDAVGILPTARYVVYYSYDDWGDSIDMLDALHPQTILAYGMNGRDLPVAHGAPVRLRVERQLGYKSMKFLHRIVVADEFEDGGEKGNIQNGWAWYTGI